jgi:hypothetical protein
MSQRSKASMKAYKDSQLPTGATPVRTAAHRAVLEDFIDSAVFIEDGVNTDVRYFFQDDFLTELSIYPYSINSGSSGWSTSGQDATEKSFGVYSLETQTNTNGGAVALGNNGAGFIFGYGHTITLKMRISLSALSDGTDTYTAYLGFIDNSSAGDHVDGCYFRYTHGTNSGKWEAVNSSNSTRTAVDTGVTAVTTNQIFTITVNSDASSVSFEIDGTSVTNTTNIPTGAGRETKYGFKIEKSAGTTNRLIYCDWYSILLTRTTAR